MTERMPLEPAAPWVELVATADDWDTADPALLTVMLNQLVLIRTFEEYVLELAGAGLIHGPAHSSIGQEGGAVGSVLPLTSADSVNGSHRGHHQFLAKTLSHVAPKGLDLLAEVSDDVRMCCYERSPRFAASTVGGAMGAAARCTCSGRKPARWAQTPSSEVAYRRLRGSRGRTGTPVRTPCR